MSNINPPLAKIVEVEWLDSHMKREGWTWEYSENEDIECMSHKSVGYVLFDNKDCLTIVQSMADWKHEDGTFNVANRITIPKVCILKTTTLS